MSCGNTRIPGPGVHLLRCMPPDIWEHNARGTTRRSERGTTPNFSGRRMLKYGRRIRSLRCREHGAYRTLTAYANLSGRDSLLPNLEALSWEHYDSHYFLYIPVFLGPRLTSLNIGDQSDSGAGLLGMLGLKQRCPRLASVVVSGVRAGPSSWDIERRRLSRFVSSLTVVETVEVGLVDYETLIHLGQLSTLTPLRVDLPVVPSFPGSPDGSLYPNLRRARLHLEGDGASVSGLLAFLRTWNNPPIESLNAVLYNCAGLEQLGDLYEELATRCAHKRLQRLEVELYHRDRSFTHAGHILAPLFTFPNMCHVNIEVWEGYDMDDSTIFDLCRSSSTLSSGRITATTHAPPSSLSTRSLRTVRT
ncbi:hypothetical protein C8R47DRAFT_10664 [Mycena vitilis]|nr:hypothetical protein C8R47DRAFT_10664 [Mycena vitilis]